MKTRRDGALCTTIPSVRNSSGLRVFIPEKGRLANRRWLQKYVLHTLGVLMDIPLSISFNDHITLTVCFATTETTITTPFTLPFYRFYLGKAANNNRSSQSFQLHADDQSAESLPPVKKTIYIQNQTHEPLRDAKLIVALRGGKIRKL